MNKSHFDKNTSEKTGMLYALSNPAMPHVLKLGYTTKKDIDKRIKALSNSSVPFDFNLECSVQVYEPAQAESVIHNTLKHYRINPKKEFFSVDVETIKNLFKTIENKPAKNKKTKQVMPKSNNPFTGKLTYTKSPETIAEMLQKNTILYQGKIYRFHQFINLLKKKNHNLDDWQLDNQNLSDIADELLY